MYSVLALDKKLYVFLHTQKTVIYQSFVIAAFIRFSLLISYLHACIAFQLQMKGAVRSGQCSCVQWWTGIVSLDFICVTVAALVAALVAVAADVAVVVYMADTVG